MMHLVPKPILNSSTGRPIWFISNLTFRPGQSISNRIKAIADSNEGLEYLEIDDEFHGLDQAYSDSWGIIPSFSKARSIDQVDLFFATILKSENPILTLYIDKSDRMLASHSVTAQTVHFGKLMTSRQLQPFKSGKALREYIESKLSLFEQARSSQEIRSIPVNLALRDKKYHWNEIENELIELDHLGKCILTRGTFKLYLTKFDRLKVIPYEIGRLRAIAFEEVGEGSGSSIDLDEFDQYYHQLFLVDTSEQSIVGGYRIGDCNEIIYRFGIAGLYTHALYHIEPSMEDFLNRSIELGRSFVIKTYQKKHLPLLLLWNGILKFLQSSNKYKYILGLVSISRAYSDVSRSLIISYLKKHHFDERLAKYFQARQAYHSTSSKDTLETVIKVFNGELIHLDEFISEIEPENYRLPVLIRKYINQNARFIGFNLDPSFSNCVDGLMMLDIGDIPTNTIQLLQKK